MIRGTTPTIHMNIINGGELDLTQAKELYLTLRQGQRLITKTTGLEISPQSVGFSLTQREALSLKEGPAEVQINWIYEDATDGTKRRAATRIKQIEINRQLLEEVI